MSQAANSEHGRSDDRTGQLDEAGRDAADAPDRDQGTDAESSLVDEAKEKAGDLWDTVKDTVSAVKEGYDEGGPDDTESSRAPSTSWGPARD